MTDPVKKSTNKPKASSRAKTAAPPASKKPAAANGTNGMTATVNGSNGAAAKNGAPSNLTEMKLSHEQVAQLAHQYWAQRGHQHGHHEEDWFRAEQELRGKAS